MSYWKFLISAFDPRPRHDKSGRFYRRNGLAIGGYDPVAYFKSGEPRKGKRKNEVEFHHVRWRFVTEENKREFLECPDYYTPQFGGYCAWGMKEDYKAKSEPGRAWTIHEGKLYLNYSLKYKKKWLKDADQYITKATLNWNRMIK